MQGSPIMQDFIKGLDTSGGPLNFYFIGMHTANGDRYRVSVVGIDHKAYNFSMQKEKSGWFLVNPETCPGWILRIENLLAYAISEQLSY